MDIKLLDLAERVAALEALAERGAEDREVLKEKQDETNAKIDELNDRLATLLNKIAKWEGKFGGVLFVLGCLWAFFSGAAEALLSWVKLMGGIK